MQPDFSQLAIHVTQLDKEVADLKLLRQQLSQLIEIQQATLDTYKEDHLDQLANRVLEKLQSKIPQLGKTRLIASLGAFAIALLLAAPWIFRIAENWVIAAAEERIQLAVGKAGDDASVVIDAARAGFIQAAVEQTVALDKAAAENQAKLNRISELAEQINTDIVTKDKELKELHSNTVNAWNNFVKSLNTVLLTEPEKLGATLTALTLFQNELNKSENKQSVADMINKVESLVKSQESVNTDIDQLKNTCQYFRIINYNDQPYVWVTRDILIDQKDLFLRRKTTDKSGKEFNLLRLTAKHSPKENHAGIELEVDTVTRSDDESVKSTTVKSSDRILIIPGT